MKGRPMKTLTAIAAAIVGFSVVAAQPAFADEFDITFKFERKHKCSGTSPKITLSGIPEGAATFEAVLKDHRCDWLESRWWYRE